MKLSWTFIVFVRLSHCPSQETAPLSLLHTLSKYGAEGTTLKWLRASLPIARGGGGICVGQENIQNVYIWTRWQQSSTGKDSLILDGSVWIFKMILNRKVKWTRIKSEHLIQMSKLFAFNSCILGFLFHWGIKTPSTALDNTPSRSRQSLARRKKMYKVKDNFSK